MFCEYLDECSLTKDSWCGLITKSFNGGGTGITSDENSFLFEFLSLILKRRLSLGVFCKELYGCWQNQDSWGGLMNYLYTGGGTCITGDANLLIFEWMSLWLKHLLSQGVIRFLPIFSPVPLLWRLPIPFRRGMMNVIWICGGVVCLLIFWLTAIKRWETHFWHDNYSCVWVSLLGIKLIASLLSQYNPN